MIGDEKPNVEPPRTKYTVWNELISSYNKIREYSEYLVKDIILTEFYDDNIRDRLCDELPDLLDKLHDTITELGEHFYTEDDKHLKIHLGMTRVRNDMQCVHRQCLRIPGERDLAQFMARFLEKINRAISAIN